MNAVAWPIGWAWIAGSTLLGMASGCATSPDNPSFPVSVDQARAQLKAMRAEPEPLARPVVVVSGWMDPGFASSSLVQDIRAVTGADRSQVIGVAVGLQPTFDACRHMLLDAVAKAFPGDDTATAEVDVVAFSMGGLVARDAAIPRPDDHRPALRIARLITIATPHRGANLARAAFLGHRETRMKPGSDFLEHLQTAEPIADYELIPYARLGDVMVGAGRSAPPDEAPWWVPNRTIHAAHLGAYRDPRILADIARRLRGEPPLTVEPRTPVPGSSPSVSPSIHLNAAPDLPVPEPRMTADITYGQADGVDLLLDAYVPAGEGPFPVALVVHGGGWASGDKQADLPLLDELAQRMTVFSINYRLAPNHPWPACLEDVRTALQWVQDHAQEYRGDPANISMIGYSAGGHLATLVAVTADDPAVTSVVGLAAPTDMPLDILRRGGLSPSMKDLLTAREIDAAVLETLWTMSPINYVRPGLPPFLLVAGTSDQSVPYPQSVHLKDRLEAVGVRCDLITLPEAPHRITEWADVDPTWARQVADWLVETMMPAPSH